MAFAVVDFETTGILPSYHHRVVEIGVTHVEDDGTISHRWETLINPERDLGPQRIHGIRAADVLDAPLFSDIAAEFADLLRGRVFAAHNAPFDLRFLEAEFERAGYWLDGGIPTVCTMGLGASFGLGASASLAHACDTHAIDLTRAHSAGADSHAAAQLLAHYQRTSTVWPGWEDYWQQTAHAGRSYRYPSGSRTGVVPKPRSEASLTAPSFLERISTEAVRETVDGAAAQYLALLDRCLLDGFLSPSERAQLADVATELGLDRASVEGLHHDYFVTLERRAWADGILTEDEKIDLATVGMLLEMDDETIAAATDDVAPAGDEEPTHEAFTLQPGALIVLTGEMTRPRSEWEAALQDRGFTCHPTVTKKVALVVAADPDSLSGKAKKARDYGIPIVGENWLHEFLR
ncbi:exonuclease domain-containing protein [Microbacterium esteraromaticum]|uniref:exonuclease domain-containing protein n=1 Tax=Microbacterium esteraromaticum TaxID=57043 RepID=UPI002368358E|nr:exonuclease domain-containing protein [Microbacterium esteraromaticum]WDH78806.1 exonuclease domain-containing protein [Microbacterium esteraromaticum]